MGELLALVALPVVFVAAGFLVLRRLVLWYWRIGEALEHLRSIDESLKCLPAVREMRVAAYRRQRGAA